MSDAWKQLDSDTWIAGPFPLLGRVRLQRGRVYRWELWREYPIRQLAATASGTPPETTEGALVWASASLVTQLRRMAQALEGAAQDLERDAFVRAETAPDLRWR